VNLNAQEKIMLKLIKLEEKKYTLEKYISKNMGVIA